MLFSVNVLTHSHSQQPLPLTGHKFRQIVRVQKTNSKLKTQNFISKQYKHYYNNSKE